MGVPIIFYLAGPSPYWLIIISLVIHMSLFVWSTFIYNDSTYEEFCNPTEKTNYKGHGKYYNFICLLWLMIVIMLMLEFTVIEPRFQ